MGDVTITSTSDTAAEVSKALGIDPATPTPLSDVVAPATITPSSPPPDPEADADEPDDADAPAPGTEPAPDGDADEEADDEGPTDPEVSQAARTLASRSKSQRRIGNLRATIGKRDRTIQALKQQLESAGIAVPPPVPAAVVPPPAVAPPVVARAPEPMPVPMPVPAVPEVAEAFTKPKPKDEDFADFNELQEAREQWIQEWTDWRLAKQERDWTRRQAEEVARQNAAIVQARADGEKKLRIEATAKKIPDFEAVMAATTVQLPREVLQRLGTDPVGMEMAYYIATHPEEATKFQIQGQTVDEALASRDAAFVELGVLRARIEAGSGAAPAAPAPIRLVPVSKAPEPMTRASGASTPASKTPDKMDQREYNAWRKAGGGR
jgi:hypothetical protein